MSDLFDRPFGIACLRAEAEDQDDLCQQAIAAVLRNRVKAGRFEPTVAGVVMQRKQFSEMNDDAIDNRALERVVNSPGDPQTARAASNYDAVMADPTLDPSGGATHFYADGVAPDWAVPPGRQVARHGTVNFWAGVA